MDSMRRRDFVKLSLAGALALAYQGCARPGRGPLGLAEWRRQRQTRAGLRAELRDTLDQCVERHDIPGAVALVQAGDEILFYEAFGCACLADQNSKAVAMRRDHRFDVASLTKMVATTTSILILRDRGALALDDPLAKYLPPLADSDKKNLTIRQCLTHVTGLPPFKQYYKELRGREAYLKAIAAEPLQNPTGAKWVYSDLGFILLGLVVEAASKQTLDVFTQQKIFEPLGMKDTGFIPVTPEIQNRAMPLPAEAASRFAATERCAWRGRVMIGEVHDENAWALGGVSGHAGLFSTAADLARFCRMLLNKGEGPDGRQILAPDSVALLCRPQIPEVNPNQALGWRLRYSLDSTIGFLGSPRAFGHTGFTGTSLWLDPDNHIFSVLLTNAVHPDRAKARSSPARQGVHNAIVTKLGQAPAKVRSGLDVLEAEGFARLRGRRVAIVTNQTAVNAEGTHLLDLLAKQSDVKVTAIFTPEHGFGAEAAGKKVGDTKRGEIPVYSLYGPRRAPAPEMAELFDVLLYDIQDVGARFYTYIWTLFSVQEFCAAQGRRIMVLDRPDPLGGIRTEGPVLNEAFSTFVGLKPVPTRYGLTPGELATLYNQQGWLEGGRKADLEIVKMENWRRGMRPHQAGLPWVAPSPNIPTWDSVAVYPGTCIFEGTGWSEGRGTDIPFEMVGGTGFDGKRLAKTLNDMDLPGCRFLPARFTPRSTSAAPKNKLMDQPCQGVFIRVDDHEAYESVKTGLAVLMAMRNSRDYGNTIQWKASHFDRLLGTDSVRKQIEAGASLDEIVKPWEKDLASFDAIRRRAIIYV